MPTDSQEKETASGARIFQGRLDQLQPHQQNGHRHHKPGEVLDAPVAKGVIVVGLFAAIWKPARVTTEEPASERLLKASAVTAMLPVRTPARNFPPRGTD